MAKPKEANSPKQQTTKPQGGGESKSAHMYGLAVDLRLSVAGLPVVEWNTRTPAKMANVVRMYRSPVYKWMALRGREFGRYPYRREPCTANTTRQDLRPGLKALLPSLQHTRRLVMAGNSLHP